MQNVVDLKSFINKDSIFQISVKFINSLNIFLHKK